MNPTPTQLRLTLAIQDIDQRRKELRKRFFITLALQMSLIALCLTGLTMGLTRADAHYARMAKVNQEIVSWIK